jgi:polysaccharide biosynthesis/export protein
LKNNKLSTYHYRLMQRLTVMIVSVWIIVAASSCGNVKNFQYLQGSYDTSRISTVNIPEPVIQKGDLLGISVYSDDPLSTAAVIRQANSSMNPTEGASNTLPSQATGYLVNQDGYLELYKLGRLYVEGLSKERLADTLEYLYAKQDLLKNPYIEVRFLNYKITVIGEVGKPGPFTIPVDKVNIFEAVGLAGDITVYGRRDNVLVIRETNGKRTFARLNLKDPNVFLSPYYYLQQNDMVIVDVYKNKAAVNNQNNFQIISLAATIVSVSAVLYSIFRR